MTRKTISLLLAALLPGLEIVMVTVILLKLIMATVTPRVMAIMQSYWSKLVIV